MIPRDDGTVAAAITAARLGDGGEDPQLVWEGHPLAVDRLGRPGAPISCRVGDALVMASSRDELERGLGRIPTLRLGPDPSTPLDSGLLFDLDPARLIVGNSGSLGLRRGAELLRGLGCGRMRGTVALKGDRLGVKVTTSLVQPAPADGALAAIDLAWLDGIPSANLMGVISMALDPSADFWDRAFALADRVERLDPAKAAVAPLRARINLLAASAGARPEVDLWPHLRGVTVSVMGDPDHPGRLNGLLLVLHTDAETSAERLANGSLPRLGALLPGGNRGEGLVPEVAGGKAVAEAAARRARRIGKLAGRALTVWRRDQDVLIAWGDDRLIDSVGVKGKPERSVAVLCNGWAREGRGSPQRIGLIWPARCLPSLHGQDATTPALRVLADAPPLVWWGWSKPAMAIDLFESSDLKVSVRRFLDQIPQNPPQAR